MAQPGAAAFFDVDRTLLAGSSGIHLARPMRRSGLITKRQLARTMLVGLAFAAQGSNEKQLDKFTEIVTALMRGWDRDTLMQVVEDELERRVHPMVFREALDRIEHHHELGQPVYAVSATMEEIIEPLAEMLGMDGAIATRMEVVDGRFTGTILAANHGPDKAARLKEFATEQNIDLAASSAYSDSITDADFLRAVGTPYAVNPDSELRKLAEDEGWEVLRFTNRMRAPLHRRTGPRMGVAAAIAAAVAFRIVRRVKSK
jgi:HAD superfamily hydrolase (TIGR01490 family)